LTGRTLYRIKIAVLKDPGLSEVQLADHVERIAETGATDGMLFGWEGSNLYLTALEDNAIKRYNIESELLETVIQADSLQWPNSMAISADGDLYITASQIHRMPRFNSGKDERVIPYKYFKYSLAFIE
jgi:sugar lactone lactonase YvrE